MYQNLIKNKLKLNMSILASINRI